MNYCRVAPSLGVLEGTHREAWGTEDYKWWRDWNKPTVFFGLYDLRDYIIFTLHKGKKWILWAGSDLVNLSSGFVLNDGKLKFFSILLKKISYIKLFRPLFLWISFKFVDTLRQAEHYVENDWEALEIGRFDIECKVVPSFLGDVDMPITFEPGNKVY